MKRKEKERIVGDLRASFSPCDVAVLTRFSGLKVWEINRVREEFKKISVDYRVVKNTLVKKAMEGTDVALLREYFQGPVAVALARGDIIPVAKLLTGFMKEFPKLAIHAGLAQGKLLTAKEVELAATLPSREELVAKLLFLLNAPLTSLMNVMQAVPAQLVRTLAAIQEQKAKAE